MSHDAHTPVVFLAFANDDGGRAGHGELRGLTRESAMLVEVFSKLQDKGLCTLVVESDATFDKIIEIFLDHLDRVLIFHFAGHAGSYQLLMETEDGGATAIHSGGIASFLGTQEGLQLVFLNGCSTLGQADALLNEGVSTVIATQQAIDDWVATHFSAQFYRALVEGMPVHGAFQTAEAKLRGLKNDDPTLAYRDLEVEEMPMEHNGWPWVLSAAEDALGWRLTDTLGSPLFGLPQLPDDTPWPSAPWRGPAPFSPSDARVFWGRDSAVRDLYEAVTQEDSPPLVVVHGPSGSSRTSLLRAGLTPRIHRDHTALYTLCDPSLGAPLALAHCLDTNPTPHAIRDAWQALAQTHARPPVVILDGTEHTEPDPLLPDTGWARLGAMIKALFGDGHEPVSGRLVICVESESLPRLLLALPGEVPRTDLALAPLPREAMVDIVLGPTKGAAAEHFDQPIIPHALAERISEDLHDPGSTSTGILLQIALSRLWAISEPTPPHRRHLTKDRYLKLRRGEGLYSGLIRDKLLSLDDHRPDEFDGGLVLDVLAFIADRAGDDGALSIQALRRDYAHADADVGVLCKALTDEGLCRLEKRENSKMVRLEHNALRQDIFALCQDSDHPAQRTRRILKTISETWENSDRGLFLDADEMAILKAGKPHMRVLRPIEARVVKASQTRLYTTLLGRLLVGVLVVTALATTLLLSIETDPTPEQPKAPPAPQAPQPLVADLTTAIEAMVASGDTHAAALLALSVSADHGTKDTVRALDRAMSSPWPSWSFNTKSGHITALLMGADGQWLATGSFNGRIQRHPLDAIESPRTQAPPKTAASLSGVSTMALDPVRGHVVSAHDDGSVRFWPTGAQEPSHTLKPDGRSPIRAMAFDSEGRALVTGDFDGHVRRWTIKPQTHEIIGHLQSTTTSVALDGVGRWIAAGSRTGRAMLWRMGDKGVHPMDLPAVEGVRGLGAVALDKNGERLAMGGKRGALFVMKLGEDGVAVTHMLEPFGAGMGDIRLKEGNDAPDAPTLFKGSRRRIDAVAFTHKGDALLYVTDGQGFLWPLEQKGGAPIALFSTTRSPSGNITKIARSPRRDRFALGSHNGEVWLWDADGTESARIGSPVRLLPGGTALAGLRFSPDGARLAAVDKTGRGVVWALDTPSWGASQRLSGTGRGDAIVKIAASSERAMAQTSQGELLQWDLNAPNNPPTHLPRMGSGHPPMSWAFGGDADNPWLAVGDARGCVEIFDPSENTLTPLARWGCAVGESDASRAPFLMAISVRGYKLAIASGDGGIRLRDLVDPASKQSLRVLRPSGADQPPVHTLRWTKNGALLAFSRTQVQVWPRPFEDSASKLLRVANVNAFAWGDPGQNTLLTANLLGLVRWNLDTGQGTPIDGLDSVRDVAVLDGGAVLAAIDARGHLMLHGLGSERSFDPIKEGPQHLDMLLASEHGRWLAGMSTHRDPSIHFIGHGENGLEQHIQLTSASPPTLMANTPNGESLVTAHEDGGVRLWRTPDALIARACAAVGRNMTLHEWDTHIKGQRPYRCGCPRFPAHESVPKDRIDAPEKARCAN